MARDAVPRRLLAEVGRGGRLLVVVAARAKRCVDDLAVLRERHHEPPPLREPPCLVVAPLPHAPARGEVERHRGERSRAGGQGGA